MKRQKIRRTVIFISFLLFPVTIWYLSPYLIIQAAFEHILNGSFWVFMGMLVLSMVNSKCTECIQCGECVDECPKKVLKYKFLWRKNK